MENPSSDFGWRQILPLGLACTFVAVYWGLNLGCSLWLDETMTLWTVSGTLEQAITRALHFQGPGVLHFIIEWFVVQVLPRNELSLRVISCAAFLLTGLSLYHLTVELYGRESAWLSPAVYLVLENPLAASVNARTYSLSLLLAALSSLFFVRWLKSAALRHRVLYVTASALLIYSHLLCLPVLLAHLLYLGWSMTSCRDNFKSRAPEVCSTFATIAVLSLPMAYQLRILFGKEQIMGFAPEPSFSALLQAIFPPLESGLLALLAVVCLLLGWSKRGGQRAMTSALVFTVLIYVVPPLAAFAGSLFLEGSIFAPRFFQWSAIALAMLIARALVSLPDNRLHFGAAFLLVLVLGTAHAVKRSHAEEWREAVDFVNHSFPTANLPLLAYTGLAESADTAWLLDPEKADYLRSPFHAYPVAARQLILLPANAEQPGGASYISGILAGPLKDASAFMLILRMTRTAAGESGWQTSNEHYREVFKANGFSLTDAWEFGHIRVLRFGRKYS